MSALRPDHSTADQLSNPRRFAAPGRKLALVASSRQWAGLALVASVTMIGALWFWLIEGFEPVDAFYQSVITVSTVGFSEVETLDRSGRMFTIGLILVGVSAMVYALGGFAEILIESSIRRFSSRRRERTLDRLNDHTIVCGFGQTGAAVAAMLPSGLPVGVIEVDNERADAASASGLITLQSDCTDDATLIAAGIERATRIIICLSNDSDAISTVLSARVLNPSIHIVTRVNAIGSARKLRLAGADHVVSPIEMGAQRLVADAMEPTIGSFLDAALSDESSSVSLRAFALTASLSQLQLSELEHETGVRVVGIQDPGGRIAAAGASAEAGQLCVAVGHQGELDAFGDRLGHARST